MLDEKLLNVRSNLVERFGVAAALAFDFQDVVVAAEFDDVADFPNGQIKGDPLERPSQCFPLEPTPVPAEITGAVFRINLGEPVEFRPAIQFGKDLIC